ncbi:MAG: hypothetical protein V1827_01235 [Candidatus Micrarchaeota archaeon]
MKAQKNPIEKHEHPAKTGRFIGMVGFVAGLALMPGCGRGDAAKKQKSEAQACETVPDLTVHEPRGANEVEFRVSQMILGEGQEIAIPAFTAPLKVVRIDGEGVEVRVGDKVERYPYGKEVFAGKYFLTVRFTFDRCPDGKTRMTMRYPYMEGITPAKHTKPACTTSIGHGANIMIDKRGRCEVKEGDGLMRFEILFDRSSIVGYKVAKIEGAGVVIAMTEEVSADEAVKDLKSWNIGFGQTKTLDGTINREGSVLNLGNVSVTAEKGKVSGTAILTINYPDAKTQ